MTTKLSTVTYKAVKPAIEALKEAARLALIAVIPLIIDSLNKNFFDWRSIGVVAAITILRAIDKYLHLEGKLEDNSNLTKGLTRF